MADAHDKVVGEEATKNTGEIEIGAAGKDAANRRREVCPRPERMEEGEMRGVEPEESYALAAAPEGDPLRFAFQLRQRFDVSAGQMCRPDRQRRPAAEVQSKRRLENEFRHGVV